MVARQFLTPGTVRKRRSASVDCFHSSLTLNTWVITLTPALSLKGEGVILGFLNRGTPSLYLSPGGGRV